MTRPVTYRSVRELLTDRLGVFTTRASVARVLAWTLVAVVGLSWVFAPDAPAADDRNIAADVPPSGVRYVAPQSAGDLSGFLAPAPQDGEFNVAWIGGSEVKLESVSLPGEFSQIVTTVGGDELVIDTYSIVAMRVTDTYRAVLSAIDNDADAIVIALNPTFTTDEWSLRAWPNLDVSEFGSLLRDPRTVGLAAAFTSPADAVDRALMAMSPLARARLEANGTMTSWLEPLDVLDDAPGDMPDGATADEADAGDVGDPRLPPDSTSFWLRQESSRDPDEVGERITGIVEGFGVGSATSNSVLDALVEAGEVAGIPVYLYATPLSPEYIEDPRYADTIATIEQHWRELDERTDAANVTVEAGMLSREFTVDVPYYDPIHTMDAAPLAEILVGRLCDQWRSLDARLECA
jgi:hypothetical protein